MQVLVIAIASFVLAVQYLCPSTWMADQGQRHSTRPDCSVNPPIQHSDERTLPRHYLMFGVISLVLLCRNLDACRCAPGWLRVRFGHVYGTSKWLWRLYSLFLSGMRGFICGPLDVRREGVPGYTPLGDDCILLCLCLFVYSYVVYV